MGHYLSITKYRYFIDFKGLLVHFNGTIVTSSILCKSFSFQIVLGKKLLTEITSSSTSDIPSTSATSDAPTGCADIPT